MTLGKMWMDNQVKCPTCRMKGTLKMFGRAMIDLNRPEPLDNQVMVTCPFGAPHYALRRIRQYFTDDEWKELLDIVGKEKARWL